LNLPKKKRKGLSRSQKQWEESIAAHIGKFIDKLTLTDVMNIAVFGASSYVAYTSIKDIEKAKFPMWLNALSIISPVGFIWKGLLEISSVGAQMMTEEQKIATSLMAGYAALKLPSVVVQQAPSIIAYAKGA